MDVGSLRPYRTKIFGRDSFVVKTVHFEKHIMPLSEETAAPERVVSIGTDSRAIEVLSCVLLPDLD
jgi:hypothetical protein